MKETPPSRLTLSQHVELLDWIEIATDLDIDLNATAAPEQRSRMGLLGYWYAHLALIAGIILIAAGIRQLLEGHAGMGLLSGGMAVFTLGDVFFRHVMGIRPIVVRSAAGAVALVLGVLGTSWGAQAALASVAATAIAVIAIERRPESPQP